jgi:hypothetical protein
LPIKQDPEGEESSKEFKEALQALGDPVKCADGNRIYYYCRIVNPPEVLLIRIQDGDENETKKVGPVVVPLEFELPKDLIVKPDSEELEKMMAEPKPVNDEFLGDVVCFETDKGRNCDAYIKNEECFRRFYKGKDEGTQPEDETVKDDLKM